jgi:hypothetical protein
MGQAFSLWTVAVVRDASLFMRPAPRCPADGGDTLRRQKPPAEQGAYELIGLPLKLDGFDASPV